MLFLNYVCVCFCCRILRSATASQYGARDSSATTASTDSNWPAEHGVQRGGLCEPGQQVPAAEVV